MTYYRVLVRISGFLIRKGFEYNIGIVDAVVAIATRHLLYVFHRLKAVACFRRIRDTHLWLKIFTALIILIAAWSIQADAKQTLRVGHFPNITHPQALVGHALGRTGEGPFVKHLGPDVDLQWYVFNAGPSAIEALVAGSIDLVYIGPTPAINAYVKTNGRDVRIIAGACNGGASLVIRADSGIKVDSDFKDKRVATPQLGNTQDISARLWLKSKGYRINLYGYMSDVDVIPTANGDQLSLFISKGLDAAWTVEPWVSRLEMEAGGKIYLEEKTLWPETKGHYTTTVLATSDRMLRNEVSLLEKWLKGHIELTKWIVDNPEEAKRIIAGEIRKETLVSFSKETMERAWGRITVSTDPIVPAISRFADGLFRTGLLREKPMISSLTSLSLLNRLLQEQGLPEVTEK